MRRGLSVDRRGRHTAENGLSRLSTISIIVPVYFNEGSLRELHARLSDALREVELEDDAEFVFVDDGSGDSSPDILRSLASEDPRVRCVFLSRNHGSFTAIRAGLHYCRGRCALIISADLQDPPELLPQMVRHWREGLDTVMATRESRSDPLASRMFSSLAYRVLRSTALPSLPPGGFDFVLIDRKVIDAVGRISEHNTTLMGLIAWMGFRQASLPYHRESRSSGSSRWSFWKKIKYLIDSMLAFSYVPIRLMSALGGLIAVGGFLYAIVLIVLKFTHGIDAPGWTALMVALLILSGCQFLAIGVIGEYLWRALAESRSRPLFFVQETLGIEDRQPPMEEP